MKSRRGKRERRRDEVGGRRRKKSRSGIGNEGGGGGDVAIVVASAVRSVHVARNKHSTLFFSVLIINYIYINAFSL